MSDKEIVELAIWFMDEGHPGNKRGFQKGTPDYTAELFRTIRFFRKLLADNLAAKNIKNCNELP